MAGPNLPNPMSTVPVRMDAEMLEAVRAEAARLGVDASKLIRFYIAKGLKKAGIGLSRPHGLPSHV